MNNKLVIFDMDGVISDTQKFHGQVEVDILNSYGIFTINLKENIPITTERISKNFAGVQPKERMEELFNIHGKSDIFDIHHIEEQKSKRLHELYTEETTKIAFIPGTETIIKDLSKLGIKTAIVTASTRECMISVIRKLGIEQNFDNLTSIYDINHRTQKPYSSKAEAEAYNNIKEELGTHTFVMIEDGRTGMIGATKAGGISIAVHGEKIEQERFPEAKIHIHDLTELTTEDIISLLG